MASALETLVRILKLEKEQGCRNTAMQGGISAYMRIWPDQARPQARKPEHFALIAEIHARLHDYDAVENRDDRAAVITYVLDRAQMRRPLPPEYAARLDEFRAEQERYQANRPPVADRPPRGERPPRPERGDRPPRADVPDSPTAEASAGDAAAGMDASRPPKRERGKDRRADAPSSPREAKPTDTAPDARPPKPNEAPKSAKPGKDKGKKPAAPPPKPPSRSDGEGGRDEFSSMEMEFASGPAALKLDIPLPPRLTRVPRIPRPPIPTDEAADILRGLKKPIDTIKGVGEKQAELFARLGVHTIYDLITFLPRRYDDYTAMQPIARLTPGKPSAVIATVQRTEIRIGSNRRRDFYMEVGDGTAKLDVMFFGASYLDRQLRAGMPILLRGVPSVYRNRLQMTHPEWEPIDVEDLKVVGIVPIYPLTEGLSARTLRRLMKRTVEYWAEHLPDYVPAGTLERAELADLGWTIKNLHFPESQDHLHHARRRWVFDQLLLLQLAILGTRRSRQSVPALPLPVSDEQMSAFMQAVYPFPLTGAQQRAIADIRRDAASDVPMNRLLQGDVGSGKTAVAVAALALAVMNGKQAALMAPTSILAEQHYRNISRALTNFPGDRQPTVALLTGALPAAERDAVYAGAADGSIDIVIGTHALIQSGLEYRDLALAVIDEQHRFGVEQRGALRGKGTNPHLLVMTATPIPRTLALTLYADLDLSVMDEMPPGRIPVATRVVFPVGRERAYELIESELSQGHQAFIVYPLVEASESIDAGSAVEAYEKLQQVFYRHKVGLLHGRMKPAEKDAVMAAFRDREFDLLVTTSVAEVGVDIPNATVILIEGANRFGLSQLHQFRGRVGRGGLASYCLLLTDNDDPDALARLRAVEATTDGFKLAEVDWKLRGAGDLVGTRQSGGSSRLQLLEQMSEEIVGIAQHEARTIYEIDPVLSDEEHRLLRERVLLLQDERTDLS